MHCRKGQHHEIRNEKLEMGMLMLHTMLLVCQVVQLWVGSRDQVLVHILHPPQSWICLWFNRVDLWHHYRSISFGHTPNRQNRSLTSLKKHNGYPRVQKTHGAMPEQPADILLKGTLRSQIYLTIRETNLQHKRYFSIHYCECANDSPCEEYTFN
jgi:hypothetical protein